jgi:tyrosine-protein phosphatase SIW14
VEEQVFRSSFPHPCHFPFLDRVGVRTVVNLLDQCPREYVEWMASRKIQYLPLSVKGNKVRCDEMDVRRVLVALAAIMDQANYPLIVHCKSGKHRTGATVGCLRMLQLRGLREASNEYVAYCAHKQRTVDLEFIGRFDPRALAAIAPPRDRWPTWLPDVCLQRKPAIAGPILSMASPLAESPEGIEGM